jgi:hypothetical protein
MSRMGHLSDRLRDTIGRDREHQAARTEAVPDTCPIEGRTARLSGQQRTSQ